MKPVQSDLVLISHPDEERFSPSTVFLHIYSLQAWSVVLSEQCLIETLGSITQTSSGFITRDVTRSHHLQNIFVIYHRRKKIVQVWKDMRASEWWHNCDFFLINYGFIQKAVCTNRSLQMVPSVLGCYATFLLPDKKKKCAWFWWMCTCSII